MFWSLSNGSNLDSNGSNLDSNGWNLDSNASSPFGQVEISIRMLRNPFEWFELSFQHFDSLLNGSNLISNGANPFRMVRIWI